MFMNSISIFSKYCTIILIGILFSCQKRDIPPTVSDQLFSINENSTSGTFVGNVVASDEDGQIVSYVIKSGNKNDAFLISETDGKISVNNEAALDFETNPSFNLTIEVRDNGDKNAFANINIILKDIIAPSTGLLLYIPFDKNVNDSGPYSNNGIDHTSDNFVTGIKSEALDFNGTTDYVALSNTLHSENGLSFSFWIKSRGAANNENNGAIVSKYSKIYNTRCFMVYSFGANDTRSDNQLSAAFYAFGYSSAYHDMTKSYLEPIDLEVFPNPDLWTITNPKRLVINEWTHCIVNLTPSSVEIWLNGKLCTKKTREYLTYADSDNELVYIGNNNDGGDGTNNHFNGILDELRIYDRELTPEEIKILYNKE